MIVIRTAEEMARALDSPLSTEIKQLLREHWEQLSEYDGYELADLALFVIAQPNDTLSCVETACAVQLVTVGDGEATFVISPEIIQEHSGWIEVVFILSDDGFGIVLVVELGTDTEPLLSAACRHALKRLDSHTAG